MLSNIAEGGQLDGLSGLMDGEGGRGGCGDVSLGRRDWSSLDESFFSEARSEVGQKGGSFEARIGGVLG